MSSYSRRPFNTGRLLLGGNMGQPITIYKDDEQTVVYGPAQLEEMIAAGWSLEKPAEKPSPKKSGKGSK